MEFLVSDIGVFGSGMGQFYTVSIQFMKYLQRVYFKNWKVHNIEEYSEKGGEWERETP